MKYDTCFLLWRRKQINFYDPYLLPQSKVKAIPSFNTKLCSVLQLQFIRPTAVSFISWDNTSHGEKITNTVVQCISQLISFQQNKLIWLNSKSLLCLKVSHFTLLNGNITSPTWWLILSFTTKPTSWAVIMWRSYWYTEDAMWVIFSLYLKFSCSNLAWKLTDIRYIFV